MNKYSWVILVFVFPFFSNGCFIDVEDKDTFSIKYVCDCIASAKSINFDKALTSCTQDISQEIAELGAKENLSDEKIEKLVLLGMSDVILELSKRCPDYRNGFLKSFDIKFGEKSQEESEVLIDEFFLSQEKGMIDSLDLIDAFLSLSKEVKAEEVIDDLLNRSPKSSYAYWMKSYLFWKQNRIEESIQCLDSVISLTDERDSRLIFESIKNSISPLESLEGIELSYKDMMETL
ncbi:MAG: tetratricopeptide repeat protein [Lewinella sp.]|jgi:hypothetical protein|uniref:tetratricopeptide repeat protein n=1 Tax=Lewinella sp. TaxID=2004506 RepID=UPI003D6B976D